MQVLVGGGRQLRPLLAEERQVLGARLPGLRLSVRRLVGPVDRLRQLHIEEVQRDVVVALPGDREELGREGARLAARELGLRVEEPGATEAHGGLAGDVGGLLEVGRLRSDELGTK